LWLIVDASGSVPARVCRVASQRIAQPDKEPEMHSSSHASALETKHAGLDARLREELGRPAPDAGTIQQLKRAKLRIKEELSQL
jgi:uncharacterized protein